VRGIESLDRHLRGGWHVGGEPSVPLLLSIFDPHTPAHDGAAVIDDDGRLERVGVHLPLTTNLAALEGRGTRHAAALGLSGSSDALVIVVSEERGQVSIARGGRMEPVETHEELSAALMNFFAATGSGRRHMPDQRPRDLEIKIGAVILAIALWFALAAPTEPVQRTYEVTVELRNAPPSAALEGPFPSRVGVTLVGPEPAFRNITTEDLRLTFDVSQLTPGENRIPVEYGHLNAPEALRAARMDIDSIYVYLRQSDTAETQ
jgi:diadenylate cyclase